MYSWTDLLTPITATGNRFVGVAVGIVTNNQDPEGMARVKVKLPWLGDNDESFWARIVTPMAGNGRGLYLLPEVDDEVLVAFEHGSIDHLFVLGSLWNGSDAPPESNSNGNNDHRTFKSRSGHIIRLDDTSGSEKIEILDKTGSNKITIQSSDNTLHIESQSDIEITSATGTVKISGMAVEIKSQANLTIEAGASANIKANGEVNVKGALINLN